MQKISQQAESRIYPNGRPRPQSDYGNLPCCSLEGIFAPDTGMMAFSEGYVEAMFWADCGPDTEMSETNVSHISPETKYQMGRDFKKFFHENYEFIKEEPARAGHDFWLTRQGHGAGFWDGDWPEPTATILTDASKAFGKFEIYLGNDGLIHHMGR